MRENFEKYEIVCVDDGCVDDTVEQVRGFLRLVENFSTVGLESSISEAFSTGFMENSDLS